MANDTKKDISSTNAIMDRGYLLKEPWWVILIAGIATLAFGAIILAWPVITLGFLVIFFGTLAIIFGVLQILRSFFLIKRLKNWWVLLIEGILGILIGIFVFVWPIGTTVLLIYFIAAWLVITGITAIAHGSSSKNTSMIVLGVLGLILGIIVFFRPPLYATATLILFIGFFALFKGIAMIIDSIVIAVTQRKTKKALTA